MSCKSNSAIYIGMTSNLEKRVFQHKNPELFEGLVPSFSRKYKCTKLIYFETSNDFKSAEARETQLKGWNRTKKLNLIFQQNPNLEDLAFGWNGQD